MGLTSAGGSRQSGGSSIYLQVCRKKSHWIKMEGRGESKDAVFQGGKADGRTQGSCAQQDKLSTPTASEESRVVCQGRGPSPAQPGQAWRGDWG